MARTSCATAFTVAIVTKMAHPLDWHLDLIIGSCGHAHLERSFLPDPAEWVRARFLPLPRAPLGATSR